MNPQVLAIAAGVAIAYYAGVGVVDIAKATAHGVKHVIVRIVKGKSK